jgi:hypothetical protein
MGYVAHRAKLYPISTSKDSTGGDSVMKIQRWEETCQ